MCRSIVFAVDIEPIGRTTVDTVEDPTNSQGLKIALERLGGVRELLERRTGHPARFHWFLRGDAQIQETWGPDWLPRACPELIQEIERHRDGTGIHPHLWRWHEPSGSWSNDPADPDWVAYCVELNCRHHAHVFGSAPRASRMGDHWISPELMPILRRNGIQYDLTIEPGVEAMPFWNDPHASGSLPDLRAAPRHPYLAVEDPLTPASAPLTEGASLIDNGVAKGVSRGRTIWMVPVSTTPPRPILFRRYPFLRRISRPANLVMRPKQIRTHVEHELSIETSSPLVLVLRSADLADPAHLKAFDYILQGILDHPRVGEARVLPVEQAMERYCENNPAAPELAGAYAR